MKATDRCATRCLSSVGLLTLAVFRYDGISVVAVSATVARCAAVTLTTAQTLARDRIAAARFGQVQVAMAITGPAGSPWHIGLAVVSVGTSRRERRQCVNALSYEMLNMSRSTSTSIDACHMKVYAAGKYSHNIAHLCLKRV